jgi:pimeloyl-ACP methyl ester carboxylesterase
LRRQDDGIEPQAFAAITAPVLMIHGDDDPHPGVAIRETLRPFCRDAAFSYGAKSSPG